jgi:small GTP-binding protein
VGKSTLLTLLTGTHSEAASYEFTTLTCIPGIIHYNDTKIQLLDLPGIIEGASEGKGRGRQVKLKFLVSIIPLIAFTILFSPIN